MKSDAMAVHEIANITGITIRALCELFIYIVLCFNNRMMGEMTWIWLCNCLNADILIFEFRMNTILNPSLYHDMDYRENRDIW